MALAALAGCKPERQNAQNDHSGRRAESLIDFPAELRAEDPSVNEFILNAIQTCMAEDYEAFRLLWSGLEEPISEQEFRRGFRATRKVTILHLLQRRTREGDIVYIVHSLVELDPNEVPEPERDIVLLLRKESGKWRVARAPREEAKALKALLSRDASTNGEATTNGQATTKGQAGTNGWPEHDHP